MLDLIEQKRDQKKKTGEENGYNMVLLGVNQSKRVKLINLMRPFFFLVVDM